MPMSKHELAGAARTTVEWAPSAVVGLVVGYGLLGNPVNVNGMTNAVERAGHANDTNGQIDDILGEDNNTTMVLRALGSGAVDMDDIEDLATYSDLNVPVINDEGDVYPDRVQFHFEFTREDVAEQLKEERMDGDAWYGELKALPDHTGALIDGAATVGVSYAARKRVQDRATRRLSSTGRPKRFWNRTWTRIAGPPTPPPTPPPPTP